MVFVFFGHPGAGKSTLARRFGALNGLPAIDTDRFMTAKERAAVLAASYTQAMRRANVRRYCAHIRRDPACRPHVALADGLPNNAARRYLVEQFPVGSVVLVLVRTERWLWERRLAARADNPVNIDVAGAEAYVRDNWEPLDEGLPYEEITNGEDAGAIDAALTALFRAHA